MGHLSAHHRLDSVEILFDLKGLNIGNKFKESLIFQFRR
jgi:hypothetical protein